MTRRSTPTVHATPHCGHEAVTPAFTASVRSLARRIRRQCRERHAPSQNTAVDFADGINGPPHPRHSLGLPPSTAMSTRRSRGTPSLPIRPPYGGRRLRPSRRFGQIRPKRQATELHHHLH
ncbi:hypothetical protein [Streptomyces sp. NPDC096311]|uniref:hypothetical protein n=1 Tax=Streptomyces sp. NPDC096311 TaxID=3366083 RepID=UPI00382803F9